VPDLEIRSVPFLDATAQALVVRALAELAERYESDSGDDSPLDPTEFDRPDGDFLVGRLDGDPVACAGWRSHGGDGGAAELKRMYTAPEGRGRGVARAMLAAVEESARRAGRKRLILECGSKQPEAIALYESSGYERIPDFGFYRGYDGVRSYGRDL
jgi:GNAT superfamily N-acetyltransferase